MFPKSLILHVRLRQYAIQHLRYLRPRGPNYSFTLFFAIGRYIDYLKRQLAVKVDDQRWSVHSGNVKQIPILDDR